MSVQIFYNGEDFFGDNDLPTPNVSRSTQNIMFGDHQGVKEILNLRGQIYIDNPPQDCNYLSVLNLKRDALANFFSKDFKSIQLKENNQSIFIRDFCKIISINFEDSSYTKTLPYSIEIECYDESIHNDFFGIKDPTNETTITKGEDDTIIIDRVISARGENTQDSLLDGDNISSATSSLQNAIDFVDSMSGESNIKLPQEYANIKVHLISQSESIDRFKNFYSINEKYLADKNETNKDNGILRYTIDKRKNFGGIKEYSMSGDLRFGKDFDFSKVIERFKLINFRNEIINKLGQDENIDAYPSLINISENKSKKSISFSINFESNDAYDSCGIAKKITHSITEIGNKVDVSVSGEIQARGPREKRWDLVSEKFKNISYDNQKYSSWINQEAQENLDKYYSSESLSLYKYPERESIREDRDNGILFFEYSFTNREKIEDFKNFQCNVNVELPSPRYSIDMNFGGSMDGYIVTRSGFKKGIVSVNASGSYNHFTGNEENDRAQAISLLKSKTQEKFLEVETNMFSNYEYSVTSITDNYSKNENIASISETREYFKQIIQ